MKNLLKSEPYREYRSAGSTNGKKIRKKFLIIIPLLLIYFMLASFTYVPQVQAPLAADNSSAEEDITNNIDSILGELDTSAIEEYLSSLTDKQMTVFGAKDIMSRLKLIISGEVKVDYTTFIGYIFSVIGLEFLRYIPVIVAIIAIAIAFNIISSIKGKFASDSVENIVYFACVSLIIIILIVQVFGLITATKTIVQNIQKQMNIFFPVILTLMTAIGAGSSVAVYQPAVAVLSSGIAQLITSFILPCFIISIVFTVVGNLTEGVKLKKMSGFFSGASKWLLGTAFFLFIAFLSVQGITASVYDGISVRTAKFAISKYIPIIGGYLSEGLNLIMAGSVLVKNAVGMTAVVLLFISVVPIVFQIIIFSLTLNLAGAILEPLGDSRISSLVTGISKNMTLLVAMVLGIAFLYFIFLILVVCTGNLVI